MENTGIWVAVAIIIFVMGSIFGLRVSPREKALGLCVKKPEKWDYTHVWWLHLTGQKSQWQRKTRASMVAYYSVLIPDARLPLMRALVTDQKLKAVAWR